MNLGIPTSLGGIGALCFGAALILTYFGHARKVALVLAVIGGMFITGAVGTGLTKLVSAAAGGVSKLSASLFGSAVPLLFLIALGCWFWHLFKGGGGSGKVKKWLAVLVAGAVGVVLAAIPMTSGLANGVVHTGQTTLTSFIGQ